MTLALYTSLVTRQRIWLVVFEPEKKPVVVMCKVVPHEPPHMNSNTNSTEGCKEMFAVHFFVYLLNSLAYLTAVSGGSNISVSKN